MAAITPATPPNDKLPDNFDPFEHLQKIYIPQHNALVKQFFSDLGTDWKPNIASPRSSLRIACTMADGDNQLMMNLRHHLFFDLLGYGRKNLMLYYGSQESNEPPVTGHPKIVFYFSQDSASVPVGQTQKADGEYSVRLMKLQNTSLDLKTKLIEIKIQFIENHQGIILTKGNLGVIYKDPANGFSNGRRILANTELDAIDLYKRMCNVIDVPFDEQKITVSNPKKPSTIGAVTETQVIMGNTRKKRAYRKVNNVRFRYAYALIPGEPNPIFLIDTTYRYRSLIQI